MPLLSRKVDYALLILSHLHHQPEGASAREVAAKFGLSRAFVANILKLLCHNGFVASHRGVKGGYVLSRSAEQVRLADLMESLDDPFRLAACTHATGADSCTLVHACPLRHAIAGVHQRLRDVLRNVTLAELFRTAPHSEAVPTTLGMMLSPLAETQLTAT